MAESNVLQLESDGDNNLEPKKWFNYSYYRMPSQYLDAFEFSAKSRCVVSLMRIMPDNIGSNFKDAIKNMGLLKERNKVFKKIFNEGVELLNKDTSSYLDLLEKEKERIIFQNLSENDLFLQNLFILISVNRGDNEPDFELEYKKYYEQIKCSYLFDYQI
jgi:hypothetical protein